LARQIHSQEEYAVDLATSGEEALKAVLKKQYHLILLSIQTKGVSNIKIVAMLRNMSPHAVIAVLSEDQQLHLPSEIGACIDVILDSPLTDDRVTQILSLTDQNYAALVSLQRLNTYLPTKD
jgi:DNA-binding response OmpR family regulator